MCVYAHERVALACSACLPLARLARLAVGPPLHLRRVCHPVQALFGVLLPLLLNGLLLPLLRHFVRSLFYAAIVLLLLALALLDAIALSKAGFIRLPQLTGPASPSDALAAAGSTHTASPGAAGAPSAMPGGEAPLLSAARTVDAFGFEHEDVLWRWQVPVHMLRSRVSGGGGRGVGQ